MGGPTPAEQARAGGAGPPWRGAFALVLALRLLSLVPSVIDDDEGWFAASANALTGPFSYFRRALDDKPPGTVWFDEAVRWVALQLGLGPAHLAQWSRLAGLCLLALTAWALYRLARRRTPEARAAGTWTALFFLLGSGAFSPKLFALTNEQLLLAPVSLAVLLALDASLGPRWLRAASAGVALGLACWVKQTALAFLLPVLLACDGLGSAALAVAGLFLTAFGGALAVGLSDYRTWVLSYPRQVLVAARRSLFSGGAEAAKNAGLFALALWPLFGRAVRTARVGGTDRERRVVLGWAVAALLAIALGRGLFPHYFLLLLPPLSLLAGEEVARAGLPRWQRAWLWVAYAGCALAAAWPFAHLFWGNDLPYFQRVADRIAQLAPPTERVFLWGGSPVPLALSGRPNATRFLTSRFLVPPYSTAQTRGLFQRDFSAHPPALVVDLHARGDNQQNAPPDALPWLGRALASGYRVWADPALPWARFYVRADLPPPPGLCPSSPLDDSREGYPRSLARLAETLVALRHGPWPGFGALSRLDARLREGFAREIAATSCREPAPGATSPLALDGPRFWIELAIVELQPVIRPRRPPAPSPP